MITLAPPPAFFLGAKLDCSPLAFVEFLFFLRFRFFFFFGVSDLLPHSPSPFFGASSPAVIGGASLEYPRHGACVYVFLSRRSFLF